MELRAVVDCSDACVVDSGTDGPTNQPLASVVVVHASACSSCLTGAEATFMCLLSTTDR